MLACYDTSMEGLFNITLSSHSLGTEQTNMLSESEDILAVAHKKLHPISPLFCLLFRSVSRCTQWKSHLILFLVLLKHCTASGDCDPVYGGCRYGMSVAYHITPQTTRKCSHGHWHFSSVVTQSQD